MAWWGMTHFQPYERPHGNPKIIQKKACTRKPSLFPRDQLGNRSSLSNLKKYYFILYFPVILEERAQEREEKKLLLFFTFPSLQKRGKRELEKGRKGLRTEERRERRERWNPFRSSHMRPAMVIGDAGAKVATGGDDGIPDGGKLPTSQWEGRWRRASYGGGRGFCSGTWQHMVMRKYSGWWRSWRRRCGFFFFCWKTVAARTEGHRVVFLLGPVTIPSTNSARPSSASSSKILDQLWPALYFLRRVSFIGLHHVTHPKGF